MNQINLLDSLPYMAPEEVPAESLEVIDETDVTKEVSSLPSTQDQKEISKDNETDDEGQIALF